MDFYETCNKWSAQKCVPRVWFLSDFMPAKKVTIHQVTTMLSTSKDILFPGHNHLLTTSTDDLTLCLSPKHQRVKGHQYQCLAGGYDLEIEHF